MNPPSFFGLSTSEDLKNFVEELKNVFQVMHVVDIERFELDVYQLRMWLGLGSIYEKGTKMRMHHIQVGIALKKPY